jgi:Lon protease-like protein
MRLRLFPLNTVLFPGMRMPLHIFEDRYKEMVRECIEENAPFGVLLIKSGSEVGAGAIPYEVGTTARILQVEYLDDGRMNIFAIGEQRFRVVSFTSSHPYLEGDVEIVEQEPADGVSDLIPKARELFGEYLKTYMALGNQWIRDVDLPEDAGEAGDYIAARTDVPPHLKQELLEQLSPAARLKRELEIIAEELPDMRARLVAHLRQKTSGFGVLN